MNILDAAVYCGTYHKYNCGSIAGGWLKLANYATKKDFLAACRKLHKNERDPEFMFQDWENIPDSMVSECGVNEEVFTVIAILKAFSADMVERFADWCDENGAEQDLQAVTEFLELEKKRKKQPKKAGKWDWKSEVRAEYERMYPNNPKQVKWSMNQLSGALKLSDGIITFEKQQIETQFPFPYSNQGGPTYEEANEMMKNFGETGFINANLREFDRRLDRFNDLDEYTHVYIGNHYIVDSAFLIYQVIGDWYIKNESFRYGYIIRQATEDEVRQIIEAVKEERAKFEAKLKSYLKRYGTDKLKTWVYWADA